MGTKTIQHPLPLPTPLRLMGYISFLLPTYVFFFFPKICEVDGNHPQEDLAKFVYRQKMKVENFRNFSPFWTHT